MKKMVNQTDDQKPFTLQATLQISPEPNYFSSYRAGPTALIKMDGKVALFGNDPELNSTLKIDAIDLPDNSIVLGGCLDVLG